MRVYYVPMSITFLQGFTKLGGQKMHYHLTNNTSQKIQEAIQLLHEHKIYIDKCSKILSELPCKTQLVQGFKKAVFNL